MTIRAALPLLAMSALGACCAPDTCPPARSGFAALGPATSAILRARDRTGAAPADLGPAFAAGGLRETDRGWAFADGRGRMVPVACDATRAELSFTHDRPGRNRCAWMPEADWSCRGYH